MGFLEAARKSREKAAHVHRDSNGYACAMCHDETRPLAFTILTRSYAEEAGFDAGFVPLSAARGRIVGCFPLCTDCAPSCRTCEHPIATREVIAFGESRHADFGTGMCQHHGFRRFVKALVDRTQDRARSNLIPRRSLSNDEP